MRLIYITVPLMMIGAMWSNVVWIRAMDIFALGMTAIFYRYKTAQLQSR